MGNAGVLGATGWMAVAAAIALVAPAPRVDGRLHALAGVGRLAGESSVLAGPGWRPTSLPLPTAAAGALVGGVVLGIGVLVGVPLALAVAAVTFAGWRTLRARTLRRRVDAARAALAAGLFAVIGELDAGSRPADALRAAAGVAPGCGEVFGRAAGEAAGGGWAGEVLMADPSTRGLGCAWALAERTGAPLAGVLRRVTADLSAESEQRRSVAVALAGPRSSAAVLTGLPVLGLALGAAMGADPLHFLLGSRAGSILGCVGVLFDVAGVLWMQAILRRAAGP